MIFKLRPALKDYLWGGTRLKNDFGFQTDLDIVAEGWMLSCHKDGENCIENGQYKGKTLSEALDILGKESLGTNANAFDRFPILIKLIDAKKDLSVQVHPDNDYALRVEGEYGKTECWYILDCDEGAELIYGFKDKITQEEFKQRVADNTFLEVVNKVKVHKGDLFFIEAGTLHAIGGGILLAEIQQNSNTTYRVYDYGRLGADGKPRPLHTEKAVEVTNCVPPTHDIKPVGALEKFDGFTKQLLTVCDLFTVYAIDATTAYKGVADEKSFVSLVVTDGTGTISCGAEELSVKKGDSVLLTANSGKFSVNGKLALIETRI